jgi:cardiolipin synthase (CMP-forming)
VLQHRLALALATTFAVGLTDWLDGWAARHLNGGETKLGLILDPLADKAMLVTLFLCCGPAGLIPIWLVVLVMGRDLVIVAGASLVRAVKGPMKFSPMAVGKVSTFFQILSILLVLILGIWEGHAPDPRNTGWLRVLVDLSLAETAFFTAISGLGYIRRGIAMARLPR